MCIRTFTLKYYLFAYKIDSLGKSWPDKFHSNWRLLAWEGINAEQLFEMRHVAAYMYKKVGRWKQSIALSKKDNLYKDALETFSACW